MSAHVSVYDRSTLIAVITDEPAAAWRAARAAVNALAHDAGAGRLERGHREWYRTLGRASYQRAGFRAVNTFRQNQKEKT